LIICLALFACKRESTVQQASDGAAEAAPTTAQQAEIQPTEDAESAAAANDEAPVISNPTPVVIDDITLPTPAYFARESITALGNPNAPVKIVEFSDFECPYCAQFATQAWPQIRQVFVESGRVYWVFKDFPLDQLHPSARLAAQAAHCAGEQDAYWEMHDALFQQQASWSGSANPGDNFKALAGQLSLNQSDFDDCLDSGRHASTVAANVAVGQAAGMSGTPTFFFNGYPASGAIPFEGFEEIIGIVERGELEQTIANSIRQAQATQTPRPIVDVPIGDAPTKGEADAPVTIVEYSDYQCPYCARYVMETMPRIMSEYVATGQVRYAYKDFPLEFHTQAQLAAQAARCAGEQGAYWEIHDQLFASQESWSGNDNAATVFAGWATDLGLDETDFTECLESERYAAEVKADLQEGAGFGVSGTPAFFVNGQFISGAQPYEVFQAAIEAALE
jgi:protein-disulfide isomerase